MQWGDLILHFLQNDTVTLHLSLSFSLCVGGCRRGLARTCLWSPKDSLECHTSGTSPSPLFFETGSFIGLKLAK